MDKAVFKSTLHPLHSGHVYLIPQCAFCIVFLIYNINLLQVRFLFLCSCFIYQRSPCVHIQVKQIKIYLSHNIYSPFCVYDKTTGKKEVEGRKTWFCLRFQRPQSIAHGSPISGMMASSEHQGKLLPYDHQESKQRKGRRWYQSPNITLKAYPSNLSSTVSLPEVSMSFPSWGQLGTKPSMQVPLGDISYPHHDTLYSIQM